MAGQELDGARVAELADTMSTAVGAFDTDRADAADKLYGVWSSWSELGEDGQTKLKDFLAEKNMYGAFLDRWNNEHPALPGIKLVEYPDHDDTETKVLDLPV